MKGSRAIPKALAGLSGTASIFDYIDHHNDNPKPFIWTAKAADILEKVKRARAALHNPQSA